VPGLSQACPCAVSRTCEALPQGVMLFGRRWHLPPPAGCLAPDTLVVRSSYLQGAALGQGAWALTMSMSTLAVSTSSKSSTPREYTCGSTLSGSGSSTCAGTTCCWAALAYVALWSSSTSYHAVRSFREQQSGRAESALQFSRRAPLT
jgi:hypothetical protein